MTREVAPKTPPSAEVVAMICDAFAGTDYRVTVRANEGLILETGDGSDFLIEVTQRWDR